MCKCNAPITGCKATLLPLTIMPTQLDLDLVMFLPICQTLDGQPNRLLHNSPVIFSNHISKDTLRAGRKDRNSFSKKRKIEKSTVLVNMEVIKGLDCYRDHAGFKILMPVLVKARGALKRKGLLEPRRKAQSTSVCLIEVKLTFLKNNSKKI